MLNEEFRGAPARRSRRLAAATLAAATLISTLAVATGGSATGRPAAGGSATGRPAAGGSGAPTGSRASTAAACLQPELEGDWYNIRRPARSLTRIRVAFVCNDVLVCAPNGRCTGGEVYYRIHPWGTCHPTDCAWGWRRTIPRPGGWERAIYRHAWGTRYVWMRMERRGSRPLLRVRVWTDFTAADGRSDHRTDDWFRRRRP